MTGTAISPKSLLQSGTPTAHERAALPLLPSGPGGIRRFPLRGAQPSTPPHEAHSTPTALEREFNPAEADCGLQGTANSPSSTVTSQLWRRGRDLNPRHRGYPCTAFPVPHLRPLGHPSSETRPVRWQRRLAEGRGFEPPRDLLGPYPISSRTPSTGLGHPSASMQFAVDRVSHSSRLRDCNREVQILSKFHSAHGLRSVTLHHAQGPPPTQLLDRAQVYPGSHETGSEGMPERVPSHHVEADTLLLVTLQKGG